MRKAIFISILVILVIGVVYIYWNYYNSYSRGNRDGRLYKFSRKGNVFKTNEGWIQYGSGYQPKDFYFSVVDEKIADSLNRCVGKLVELHYVQYRRSLPWRGDNYNSKLKNSDQEPGQYIIDQIVQVKE